MAAAVTFVVVRHQGAAVLVHAAAGGARSRSAVPTVLVDAVLVERVAIAKVVPAHVTAVPCNSGKVTSALHRVQSA